MKHLAISHPSFSLQGFDGPPGKIGFPGPQVKHRGTLIRSVLSSRIYSLPLMFPWRGEASEWFRRPAWYRQRGGSSRQKYIRLEGRTVLGRFFFYRVWADLHTWQRDTGDTRVCTQPVIKLCCWKLKKSRKNKRKRGVFEKLKAFAVCCAVTTYNSSVLSF